ncbi:cytochrome [Streptosporangium nondiastaticum]|uniref:Cytochrome n=1 Tax=Streptosporangium nondiastaticum TaxID=35764 RepID=A0A9X7PEG8_9ACTN|nr:cytochrome [Streptosporangium nondiastaticum]
MVSRLVALIAPQKTAEAAPEARLIGDLGYHSLALAELGFTIEDVFGLDALPPERTMALERVGDIVTLVEEEVAAGTAVLPGPADVSAIFARYGTEWTPAA